MKSLFELKVDYKKLNIIKRRALIEVPSFDERTSEGAGLGNVLPFRGVILKSFVLISSENILATGKGSPFFMKQCWFNGAVEYSS